MKNTKAPSRTCKNNTYQAREGAFVIGFRFTAFYLHSTAYAFSLAARLDRMYMTTIRSTRPNSRDRNTFLNRPATM